MFKLRAYIIVFISFLLVGTLSTIVFADYDDTARDISRSGIGARPLGMGKAYVALADDANAVLMNPAGLAYFSSPKLMNINSQLLHDVYYKTYALAWPTQWGTFGAGYVDVAVNNILLAEWQGSDAVIVGNATYANNVFIASYANRLSSQFAWGLNLKSFNQGFAGLKNEEAGARGGNLDIGLLYKMSRQLSWGLMYQNAVTNQSLLWGSGDREIIESYVKTGLAYDYKQPTRRFWFSRMVYAFDVEIPVVASYRAATYHFGTEQWFADVFAIRAGVGTREIFLNDKMSYVAEPSLGLGLNLWGFQVDYTYAPGILDLGDRAEKFFLSLSYHQPDEEIVFKDQKKDRSAEDVLTRKEKSIEIDEPIIVRQISPQQSGWSSAKVRSRILKKNIITAKDVIEEAVDYANVLFETKSGQQNNRMRLYPGENWLAYSIGGQEYLVKFLVVKDYADVNSNTPGYAAINALSMAGLLNGHFENRLFYKPFANVDYGEFEKVIQRIQQADYDLAHIPKPTGEAITRREAIVKLTHNFGGEFRDYVSIFPKQLEADIMSGQDGGYLARYELAQLLVQMNVTKERLAYISEEYNMPMGEIYFATDEDLNY